MGQPALGGTGVFFNNGPLPHITSQTWGNKSGINLADFNIQRSANDISCQTHYPSVRQIGQTWIGGGSGYSYPGAPIDGTGYATDPAYFWNNGDQQPSDPGYDDYVPDECGNGMLVANFVKPGRDFFWRQAQSRATTLILIRTPFELASVLPLARRRLRPLPPRLPLAPSLNRVESRLCS